MQSSVDKEVMEQLKDWNPMRDAYNDSKFNKYMSGPGADLEDSLQPSELGKQNRPRQRSDEYYLVFRNVPESLTVNGLVNICSGYGKVERARPYLPGMYFVNFATINDMERVFTGLENNSYGFTVQLGNKVNKDKHREKNHVTSTALPSSPAHSENYIDYERSYQTSARNPPRPRITKEPVVSRNDYDKPNSLLNRIDPQRHFLIEDDAFELDRVAYHKQNPVEGGKYNYHTGRAYYEMSQKDKQFIEEKRKTTSGSYRTDEEKFCKPSPVYGQMKVGPCESCQKVCDIVCSRCSSFFCSAECQTKEWQRHRYSCGKPPGLFPSSVKGQPPRQHLTEQTRTEEENCSLEISHRDSTQQAALKSQLPESGNKVFLTAISKTNVVFVRSMAYDDNLQFFNTVSLIQKGAKYQHPLQHTPQRGDIVLTKFADKHYNRAMILNPDDLDHIKLIYIDYGNIDIKTVDQLLNAPDQFWHLPRMAVPIILKDVPDFFMTDDVKNYMFTYLNAEMKIVYEKDDVENGVNRATLFDLVSNDSYNETIVSLKSITSEPKDAPVFYRENLKHLPLPEGENVKLVVLDNSLLQTAFISCTTKEYAHSIRKFQDDIQKFISTNDTNSRYTPRVNELCIAKYDEDDLWYRGRCIELVGDGHPSILFFDYGNISIVSVNNIRKYPEEFAFPIMTGDCEISGLPKEIDDELKKKLEEALPAGNEIVCDKVEKSSDNNSYVIYLEDVLRKVLD